MKQVWLCENCGRFYDEQTSIQTCLCNHDRCERCDWTHMDCDEEAEREDEPDSNRTLGLVGDLDLPKP